MGRSLLNVRQGVNEIAGRRGVHQKIRVRQESGPGCHDVFERGIRGMQRSAGVGAVFDKGGNAERKREIAYQNNRTLVHYVPLFKTDCYPFCILVILDGTFLGNPKYY